KGGVDTTEDYYDYIDELVENGKYGLLDDVMIRKYKIDVSNYSTVSEFKKRSYPIIRFHTSSTFQTDIKKLYDNYNVHQIGFNIINGTYGVIGTIREVESSEI